MNTNFTPSPQEELEARITALLLGELPPEEAAALEAQIAGDAELQRVRREIEETIPFLKEALQPAADLKLSPERWAQMTKSFKIIQTDELGAKEKKNSQWRTVAMLAAMLAALFVCIGTMIPTYTKSKGTASRHRQFDTLGDADETLLSLNAAQPKAAEEIVASADRKDANNSHFGIVLPSNEAAAVDLPAEPQAAPGFGEATAGQGEGINGRTEMFGGFAGGGGGGGGQRGAVLGGNAVELQRQVANQPAPDPAPSRAPLAAMDSLSAAGARPLASSAPGAPPSSRFSGIDKNSTLENKTLESSTLEFQRAPAEESLGLASVKEAEIAGPSSKSSDAKVYYYKANPEGMKRELPELKSKVAEAAKKDELAYRQKSESRSYLQAAPAPNQMPAAIAPQAVASPRVAGNSSVLEERTETVAKAALADTPSVSAGDEVRLLTPASAASKPAATTRGLGREELERKAGDAFGRRGELKKTEAVNGVVSNDPTATGGVYSVNAVGYVNVQLQPGFNMVSNPLDSADAAIDGKFKLPLGPFEVTNRLDSADTAIVMAKPVAPVPQPEVQVAENAFSTFSLNVSDVSFKLAGASLEKGLMPEAGGIRSEEFLNAFDYRDAEAIAAPVAFAWERARYPFAQDREVLRLSIKTAASGRQAGRPLNLVLLLDNSGSMERADRVQILRDCLRTLTAQLTAADRVSVVTFARTARLAVDGLTGAEIGQLPQRVGALAPEGGTNLEEAMRLAYETAQKHFLAGGVNRVVMLTDGAANLGDVRPEALKQTVETQRRKGIALDCFGIGWDGLNDELLETLSRNGDGRYGFVNTPEAAATEFSGQLAGALKVAASDVKVQVEFNPKRVTAYRQIGYAKHQLTKEQFRDNTVDAAELGAAEAGNAVYIAQVNPRGEGPLGTVRARFKIPGTNDYREHEWPLTFDGPARPAAQANYSLRLATAAAAFSEWLASSPYAGEVTSDNLLQLMAGVPEFYAPDPRPKKLETMIREAKGIAGR